VTPMIGLAVASPAYQPQALSCDINITRQFGLLIARRKHVEPQSGSHGIFAERLDRPEGKLGR
jgi:hypothetical protein